MGQMKKDKQHHRWAKRKRTNNTTDGPKEKRTDNTTDGPKEEGQTTPQMGQKKKDKQHHRWAKRKRTDNNLHSIHIRLKIE
jgi:hypothetical protein